MTLLETVNKITGLSCTEDEAMAFARDNFPALVRYIHKNIPSNEPIGNWNNPHQK